MKKILERYGIMRSYVSKREILLTRVAVYLTLAAGGLLAAWVAGFFAERLVERAYVDAAEEFVMAGIIFFFIYGNLVYQVTRIGYLKRFLAHRPVFREELERIYDDPAPTLTMLIPSYKEQARVIRQSLLSAALQEYPHKKVVLLIDDPPRPSDANDLEGLLASRRLPLDIQQLLGQQKARLKVALAGLISRMDSDLVMTGEYTRLASIYRQAADWFEEQASHFKIVDHTDRWFVRKILRDPAGRLLRRAEELEHLAEGNDRQPDGKMLLREYRKLVSLFDVEITSFERKQFMNLSHESNKAMNLNSYIGLMGKSFRTSEENGRVYLEESGPREADFSIADTDYLITLDADSILDTEYALRLINVMEQLGNERLAVVQTPYNAVPGTPVLLERIAGATTDIQYIMHQGFTHSNATFWVGANALLRKKALEDICVVVTESGHRITKYIQDRTVIEDTESSVDLIDRGWRLFNYPGRLSYSATPPDFGALLIQRRRWANGGLIILPKLLRYLFRDKSVHRRLKEGLCRLHYLTSLAGVNMGLLIILVYPFKLDLPTMVLLSLLFVINSFVYWRDLAYSGYRGSDLFRIYALNLMLIPINLGGVFKSLQQAATGKKIPFGRTPKVTGRTAVPAFYILAEFAILLLSVASCIGNAVFGRLPYAAFAFMNSLFFFYIIRNYLGLNESVEDLKNWWTTSPLSRHAGMLGEYYPFLKGTLIVLTIMVIGSIGVIPAY